MPVGGLTLPEVLTEADIFANLDMSSLLGPAQLPSIETNDRFPDSGLDWTSTLNPEPSSQSRLTPEERPQLEDDTGLILDLGEDVPIGGNDTSLSIEVGRNAPAARPIEEDLFSDDNKLMDDTGLVLDLGEDVAMPDARPELSATKEHHSVQDMGDDERLATADEDAFHFQNAGMEAEAPQPLRDSQSPLSDARSDVIRDLDHTFGTMEAVEEEVVAQQPQRSRKRKLLVRDTETVIHNHQIKDQQNDRSRILKPVSFLPKDPLLLTLMNMQKNGEFVSNVMGEGRSRGWAPELQGLLSIDAIRGAGERKRKRDSGVADISGDEHAEKSPRVESPQAERTLVDEGVELGVERTLRQTQYDLPADDGVTPLMSDGIHGETPVINQEDEDEGFGAGQDEFDDTSVPLIHPADSGPVSLGTKHAVHLLRDRFGGEEADGSPSSQVNKSVLFQDLLPEGKTSREDATKMFFEVLVLATKDAVKVEQSDQSIGGPLRIRGKRGLWGSWAETEAGGEIEREERNGQFPIASTT